MNTVQSVYFALYPGITEASLHLPTLYKKYRSLVIGGERYESMIGSRCCPYARISASWCGENGTVIPGRMRPGIIRCFMVHSVEIGGKQHTHAFAVVNWLKPSQEDFGFGNPLSVWLANNFEKFGAADFLPV